MKASILFMMLFASTASFAQDDAYFDDVIESNTITKNILVEENEVINYYHKKNVKVNHYSYSKPTRAPRYSRPVYRRQATCNGYRRVEPQTNNYKPVARSNKWAFFFDFNSAYLNNKEELGHLIDHVKYSRCKIYIDAYGDRATGDYDSNMEIAEKRANTIINYLEGEGIDTNRMFVQCLGSSEQVFGNNSLNRCVIVKVGSK